MSAEYVIRDWQACVDHVCKSFPDNPKENSHFLKSILISEIQPYQYFDVRRGVLERERTFNIKESDKCI